MVWLPGLAGDARFGDCPKTRAMKGDFILHHLRKSYFSPYLKGRLAVASLQDQFPSVCLFSGDSNKLCAVSLLNS